ncbi:hypothetical protein F3Y22_tig00111495pilonHSYRG00091 [Hibiscus syriacus]|uniref:Neprosin PEP catalytic domain-containing protein n=1 Tax=Hibiscus syriacus TaxID=106335 RepID=A0A6A2XPZ5_HIBSY|nr:hypothetical protein F3Y22_tig00111495pilonHSYRG00091 [Hibiscus syriacus]
MLASNQRFTYTLFPQKFPFVKQAATLVALGSRYIGAKGDINVWNPSIGSDGVFTTGQIWVKGGPVDDYESLESGWIVHPVQYGDKRTRFFLYWTTGSTSTTGCFDHNCDGFVQISREIALGAAIEPLSRSINKQLVAKILGWYADYRVLADVKPTYCEDVKPGFPIPELVPIALSILNEGGRPFSLLSTSLNPPRMPTSTSETLLDARFSHDNGTVNKDAKYLAKRRDTYEQRY